MFCIFIHGLYFWNLASEQRNCKLFLWPTYSLDNPIVNAADNPWLKLNLIPLKMRTKENDSSELHFVDLHMFCFCLFILGFSLPPFTIPWSDWDLHPLFFFWPFAESSGSTYEIVVVFVDNLTTSFTLAT